MGLFTIIFLFLWNMCFFAAYFFSTFLYGQVWTPKNCQNREISRVFSRRRANAIPRPHDVMIVPVVLMQCSSHLGPAVHFFGGRRLWWCSEANRGGRKWFFAAYSRGEVKYTAYSCNLRWSFAGF